MSPLPVSRAAARAALSGISPHRPEGDRVSALLDGGNAVLPHLPGFAAHHVARTGFGGQREALPLVAHGATKPELAGSPQREPEDFVEMRLVAVPPDANADIVFGAKDLPDACLRQFAEPFNGGDDRCQPARDRLGFLKLSQRIIIAETERRDPSFAFEG